MGPVQLYSASGHGFEIFLESPYFKVYSHHVGEK